MGTYSDPYSGAKRWAPRRSDTATSPWEMTSSSTRKKAQPTKRTKKKSTTQSDVLRAFKVALAAALSRLRNGNDVSVRACFPHSTLKWLRKYYAHENKPDQHIYLLLMGQVARFEAQRKKRLEKALGAPRSITE